METEKKLLLCARICVGLLAALLAVLCAVSVLVVPKTLQTLERMNDTLQSIDSLMETAEDALEAANDAANSANKLVADNADAVAEAMEKFNSVDFEALNRAINDLADIVEPLAKLTSYLR